MSGDREAEALVEALVIRDDEIERLRSVNAQLLAFMREILMNVRDPARMSHAQAVFRLEVIEQRLSAAIKAADMIKKTQSDPGQML